MLAKKKYLLNITLSVIFLILILLIFFVNIKAQIKSEKFKFQASIPLKRCPQLSFNQTFNNFLASDNDSKIFVSYFDSHIESVDLQAGSKIWKTELGGKIISRLILDKADNKTIYVVTKLNSAIIWAINAETGITKWQVTIPFALSGEVFLYNYQDALVVVCKNGKVLSFDKSDGTINWIKSINFAITSNPSFFEDRGFLSTANNKIFSIVLADGMIVPQISTLTTPNILLALTKKEFVWTDKTGRFFFRGNQKFRAGAEISNIIATSNGILIASNDNFLYLISTDKQKILWKKKLAGRVFPKPLIINNWAIVPVLGESELLVVDLTNGKVINNLTIEKGNYFADDFFISFNKLFTPTIKGLYSFTTANVECF
jgi:outer membrane protein assembly factor BamB